jgi:hypothetical protein
MQAREIEKGQQVINPISGGVITAVDVQHKVRDEVVYVRIEYVPAEFRGLKFSVSSLLIVPGDDEVTPVAEEVVDAGIEDV